MVVFLFHFFQFAILENLSILDLVLSGVKGLRNILQLYHFLPRCEYPMIRELCYSGFFAPGFFKFFIPVWRIKIENHKSLKKSTFTSTLLYFVGGNKPLNIQ